MKMQIHPSDKGVFYFKEVDYIETETSEAFEDLQYILIETPKQSLVIYINLN